MYKISVLLPSAYPEKLEKFLASLQEKSVNFNDFEIIVVLDGESSDLRNGNILYTYHKPTNFRSKFFEHAYRKSSADWIWLANDDLEIQTQDWDKNLDLTDPYCLHYFKDNNYNGEFACHPLTSRKIWEMMDRKGIVFPEFINMGCDTTIWDIMPYQLKKYHPEIILKHDRFLDDNKVREIENDYVYYNTFVGQRKEIEREIANICNLKPSKIVIGVPTGAMARRAEFYIYRDILIKPENTLNTTGIGQSPAENRNSIIETALKNNASHVLFLDDDVAFKPNLLMQLLSHNKDIVTGLCLRRNHPHRPLLFDKVMDDGRCKYKYLNPEDEGLIEIVNCGLGCVLIKTEVFKAMEKPWIRLGELEQDKWCDDIGFFNRVREKGFKLYCDLDCHVGHMVDMTIWPMKNENGWQTLYDTTGESKIAVPQQMEVLIGTNQ